MNPVSPSQSPQVNINLNVSKEKPQAAKVNKVVKAVFAALAAVALVGFTIAFVATLNPLFLIGSAAALITLIALAGIHFKGRYYHKTNRYYSNYDYAEPVHLRARHPIIPTDRYRPHSSHIPMRGLGVPAREQPRGGVSVPFTPARQAPSPAMMPRGSNPARDARSSQPFHATVGVRR